MTFLPENGVSRKRIPGVAFGPNLNGSGTCIHFRKFSQTAPGIVSHTGDGITLTIAQFNAVVEWVGSTIHIKQKPTVGAAGSELQELTNNET